MGWLSKLFGGGKREETGMEMAGGMQHMAASDRKTAKDPVCGMDVDTAKAAAKSEYKGQTYYFCAPGCKRAFDKEPEKYLKGAAKGH